MIIPEIVITRYVFGFGILLIIMGCIEMLMPMKAFLFWGRWAANRYFFIHGLLLIVFGFPLTMYHGRFETVIFIIGIFIVFSGPFILLFPDRFKKTFEMAEEEMGGEVGQKRLIYFEAIVRIAAGIICFISYLF